LQNRLFVKKQALYAPQIIRSRSSREALTKFRRSITTDSNPRHKKYFSVDAIFDGYKGFREYTATCLIKKEGFKSLQQSILTDIAQI
jgi:hypothetical protein